MKTIKILMVDDNRMTLKSFEDRMSGFQHDGFEIEFHSEYNYKNSIKKINEIEPHVVILDIYFDDEKGGGKKQVGVDLLRTIKKDHPSKPVFMITGEEDPEVLKKCLRYGADEFIKKRDKLQSSSKAIINIFKRSLSKTSIDGFDDELDFKSPVIGKSMVNIAKQLKGFLNSKASTLFLNGPTGSGKGMIVKLLEELVKKQSKDIPFIYVNSASFSDELSSSELFGHTKGAFTGAKDDSFGLLKDADGGFLFLDEIDAFPMKAQGNLLTVIEDQKYQRIGAKSKPIPVNIRLIVASNKNLKNMPDSEFKHDLYNRLIQKQFKIDPLSKRMDEIEEFAKYFAKICPAGKMTIDPIVIELLKGYTWDEGNIRELRHCIFDAGDSHIREEDENGNITYKITPGSISEEFRKKLLGSNKEEDPGGKENIDHSVQLNFDKKDPITLEEYVNQCKAHYIIEIHKKYDGHKLSAIAKLTGCAYNTYKYQIELLQKKGYIEEDFIIS